MERPGDEYPKDQELQVMWLGLDDRSGKNWVEVGISTLSKGEAIAWLTNHCK